VRAGRPRLERQQPDTAATRPAVGQLCSLCAPLSSTEARLRPVSTI